MSDKAQKMAVDMTNHKTQETAVDMSGHKVQETTTQKTGDSAHVAVDVSAYQEPHNTELPVLSFAIESHQRNTLDNPLRENTNMMPVLVRRVNSEELLPRPFKSTSQMLCASYLLMFCCCFFASYATHHAWRVKEKRNKGALSGAVRSAKITCCWMKVALGTGICSWIIGIVFLALFFSGYPL